MRHLLKNQEKKDSMKLLICLKKWERLKRNTKKDTANSCLISKAVWCSQKKGTVSGSARTAVILQSAKMLPKNVRYVRILSLISRLRQRIIRKHVGLPANGSPLFIIILFSCQTLICLTLMPFHRIFIRHFHRILIHKKKT